MSDYPGGGTTGPMIRREIKPGGEATVWDPTRVHGDPGREHTDAEVWRRRENGRPERTGEKVHIPENPGQHPW
jgi:hypothetical protein